MNTRFLKTTIVKPVKKCEIHRAGWLIVNPWHIIKNGYVKIENHIIKEVSKDRISSGCLESDYIDHGTGVLMSPLVNAHTHLELSFFKDKLEYY